MSEQLTKYLYAVVIGLLFVAFIGFGLATFYPAPTYPNYPKTLEYRTTPSETLTPEERKQEADYQILSDKYQEDISAYNLNTSMILIGISVIVLAISILGMSSIAVIGEGLTLGGFFTLLYGLGRGIAVDNNIYRFVAVTAGLAIILFLTYVKFIRKASTLPTNSQTPN